MPNWNEIFNEVQLITQTSRNQADLAITLVRHKYLKVLQAYTKRNVIAYYSGWLSKPGLALSDINDEDKAGFMTTIHKMDRKLGLDLILHTPGGGIAATQSIVNYLQKMFGSDIRAIVPQIAMSAGTIIACCCKEILMGKQSNLGPIDPQLRGIPAAGVRHEFRRAVREIRRDPTKTVVWQQIIGQYRPTFLGQCENAIKWSNDFVIQQLTNCMLRRRKDRTALARKVARKLSDYSRTLSHERHFHAEELLSFGLNIKYLEADPRLQDAVLSVHHSYMLTLMNTAALKIIENHNGVALVKNAPTVPVAPLGLKVEPPT